jgi:cellobiose phosphorylase
MSDPLYTYQKDGISFISPAASGLRTLYFPLCGITTDKVKSSITPFLSGDIKIDKNHYVTKPVSIEELRHPTRDFFVHIKDKGVLSVARPTDHQSATVEAGPLWHRVKVDHPEMGVFLDILHFVPVSGDNVEIMKVTVTNTADAPITITPTAVYPLFARALANKHDHEHVTSLLNRMVLRENGVLVEPTMLFNEEGHTDTRDVYFCLGTTDRQEKLQGTFPTTTLFCGEAGTMARPQAVYQNRSPRAWSEKEIQGQEAVGALRFIPTELASDEKKEFYIVAGMAGKDAEAEKVFQKYNTDKKIHKAWQANQDFWDQKSRSLLFETGNPRYNAWVRWVELQPVLRRIYGCSFLPDHDYGKGGRGWRDIWQDLLSLILIEPQAVRETLVHNFAGVRIDGSNATIIGAKPGEFIADRNAITRVWMDHGAWPWMTLLLYIHQTGDYGILLEENTYFRDPQLSRTFKKDFHWTADDGNQLKDSQGRVVKGSVIEHLLIENLVPFFNVGEHNIIRLESADWNDGLDMAFERGESVTFMSLYGGNLREVADTLEDFARVQGVDTLTLASEVLILLDSISGEKVEYNDASQKKRLLFDAYFDSVEPEISGETEQVKIKDIVSDLRLKAQWIQGHLQKQEKLKIKHKGETYQWFNGYYDNQGQRVEGIADDTVRVTLAGQVFPIMSGVATEKDIPRIIRSVQRFLRDKDLGGYRLNSDFGLRHYLDLGRAFGFAYGTKENGAFFSHMAVMYAYALYKRGFAREGHAVLDSIYQMCMDTGKSKIFPGIPEYFNNEGRGKYHYLTGSASWYIYTVLTQVFGVSGMKGDLSLAPCLVAEQFNAEGQAGVRCQFAGKQINVRYVNRQRLDHGDYAVQEVICNHNPVNHTKHSPTHITIPRRVLEKNPSSEVIIDIILG